LTGENLKEPSLFVVPWKDRFVSWLTRVTDALEMTLPWLSVTVPVIAP
jgi:hypothetical protein